MDVLVPPIPDGYDDYRATLKAFIAAHKPVLAWKQRTGVRVPDRADDVELLRATRVTSTTPATGWTASRPRAATRTSSAFWSRSSVRPVSRTCSATRSSPAR